MKKVIQHQTIKSFRDRDSGAVFKGLEFIQCDFVGCALSITRKPELRATIRNVTLNGCSQRGCSIGCAALENISVADLNTNGQVFQTFGAVMNKVVLQGRIDRVMISPVLDPGVATPEEQAAFDKANAAYYHKVKWALDISKAEVKEFDIEGIPSHLIRRDPDTQIIVSKARVQEYSLKKLRLNHPVWIGFMSRLLSSNESSGVFVAPKRHRQFDFMMKDIHILRKIGLAEPD